MRGRMKDVGECARLSDDHGWCKIITLATEWLLHVCARACRLVVCSLMRTPVSGVEVHT